MDSQLVIEIIGGLTVVAITSLASFIAGKTFFKTDSPLPPILRPASSDAYQYLNGSWYEYHITQDPYLYSGKPYWLKDVWRLQVKDGYHISGILEIPRPGEIAKYKLLGEIRQSRMVITGSSIQDPSDFFTAIFPKLKDQHPIVGTMLAFDWDYVFYTGPVMLSNLEMDDLDELAKTVATAKPKHFYGEQKINHLCTTIESMPAPISKP